MNKTLKIILIVAGIFFIGLPLLSAGLAMMYNNAASSGNG